MMKMTGTTIAGLVYADGVILGADTRATMQDAMGTSFLIDHECYKINRLADNIYCCGAGSAADMKRLSRLVEVNIGCQTFKRVPPICPVTMIRRQMYRYKQSLNCAFIIGGVDTEPQLFTVNSGGSSHAHKYCALGSGLLPATGILEGGWKENLLETEALDLLVDAVTAGIMHDIGSGSNIDIIILRTSGHTSVHKAYKRVGQPIVKHNTYDVPLGTAKVLSTQVIPVEVKYQRGWKRKDEEESKEKAKRLKTT